MTTRLYNDPIPGAANGVFPQFFDAKRRIAILSFCDALQQDTIYGCQIDAMHPFRVFVAANTLQVARFATYRAMTEADLVVPGSTVHTISAMLGTDSIPSVTDWVHEQPVLRQLFTGDELIEFARREQEAPHSLDEIIELVDAWTVRDADLDKSLPGLARYDRATQSFQLLRQPQTDDELR